MTLGTLNQRGYINVAVGSTPVSLADEIAGQITNPSRFHHVFIGVVGGAIRWQALSDRDPSPAQGSYVGAGGQIDWTNPEVDYASLIYNVKFVAVGAPVTLEVALFW